MAFTICEPCIGTKDTACVDVCPVDCIHPRKDEDEFESEEKLYIHPDECIDCGACVPACPVEAIFANDEVPDKWTNYIEIDAGEHVPVGRETLPPGRARLACGGGFEAALLAHVGEGAPRDLMPEVAAGTPNTGVAPLAVLGGHPDDAPADRVQDPWAARSATAAAVVLPRDQLSMPAEEGIGRDQGVPVTAYPSPEARGLCGPAPALGVGEPEPARTERLSEDAILFLERVNDVTRLLVDPARDGHDEELQHLGNRRQTGRAEQRLSAVTNVATRRASSGESARRTASIGYLDSTGAN